jgi:hypothetical protein
MTLRCASSSRSSRASRRSISVPRRSTTFCPRARSLASASARMRSRSSRRRAGSDRIVSRTRGSMRGVALVMACIALVGGARGQPSSAARAGQPRRRARPRRWGGRGRHAQGPSPLFQGRKANICGTWPMEALPCDRPATTGPRPPPGAGGGGSLRPRPAGRPGPRPRRPGGWPSVARGLVRARRPGGRPAVGRARPAARLPRARRGLRARRLRGGAARAPDDGGRGLGRGGRRLRRIAAAPRLALPRRAAAAGADAEFLGRAAGLHADAAARDGAARDPRAGADRGAGRAARLSGWARASGADDGCAGAGAGGAAGTIRR